MKKLTKPILFILGLFFINTMVFGVNPKLFLEIPKKQRIVVFINGTSCSGKTTIIKKLMPLLGNSWVYIPTTTVIYSNLDEKHLCFLKEINKKVDLGFNVVCETMFTRERDYKNFYLKYLYTKEDSSSKFKIKNILIYRSLENINKRVGNINSTNILPQFKKMYKTYIEHDSCNMLIEKFKPTVYYDLLIDNNKNNLEIKPLAHEICLYLFPNLKSFK